MSNSDHYLTWLVCLALPNVGRLRLLFLLHRFETPDNLLRQPPARLAACGLCTTTLTELHQWQRQGRCSAVGAWAQAQLDQANALSVRLLSLSDPEYPDLLREIPDPPPLLFALGDINRLQRPALAIVGSRRASATGLADARAFAAALGSAGFCIVSGLALGVDGAAHEGALEAGAATVAVLGTGLDVIYPKRHTKLYRRIASEGLLLSEQPLGAPPHPGQFPARNRIISGLSLGTLVVEAAANSGSLITARLAAEQNREVFALPGSIHHPASRGCNGLIRQGATLVQEAGEILEQLTGWAGHAPAPKPPAEPLDPEQRKLLRHLGFEPTSLESLAERSGVRSDQLLSLLGELELEGFVESRHGAYQRVVDPRLTSS